ncbi:MAG: NTP transferase domain-containing protein, partial [Proteobacteria bacterium]|nr:NTP transferase domain-containing protein [Pseudomonadota bacterium]
MQEQSSQIAAIVLAAGKGTRMKSQKPKVLHPVCGTPMLGRVLRSLQNAGIKELCVVIGGDIEPLQTYLKAYEPITLTMQTARLGTGEAVACAGYGFEASPVPS